MMEQKPPIGPSRKFPIEGDSSALSKTDAIWRGILESSLDGLVLLHKEGTIEQANEIAADQLDRHGKSVIGTNYFSLLPPDLQSKRKEQIDLALSSTRALHWEDEWNQRFFSNTAFGVKDGESVVVTSRESTELKIHQESAQNKHARLQTLKELRYWNSLYRALLELALDGILIVGNTGQVVTYNKRFVDIWNVTEEMMRPEASAENRLQWFMSQIENPENFLERILFLHANPSETGFDEIVFKNGHRVERYSVGIVDEGNVYHGRIWYFRDVTERRQAEELHLRLRAQLHQSQKMDALGQLAGGVAHDVNNALAVIVGAAELLLDGRKPEEAREKFTKMILQASERAGDLTKKLLAFARKSPEETHPVDMKTVIEDTAAILRHTVDRNIQIFVDDRASATTVMGDEALLQTSILNLGINASQAMQSGGTITFVLDNITLDRDYCQMAQFSVEPGQYLQIAVCDTGSGIPLESLPRIFEPFFTTKDRGKGTGLGLAVVYGAIQKHRGAITVYSHVGDGTIFHVYLPVSEKSVIPRTEAAITHGTGTVLVIDDDELIRATTRTMLSDLGYEVFEASNGVEGMKVLEELPNQIDLALVDMVMPVMNGREVINEIHKLDNRIPIVVSSGFSKEGEWAELKACGAVAFLRKPFRRAELARAIAESIR